ERRRLAHVHHEAARPAVVEEAVDGVGEVRRLGEVAERLHELAPVRDQDRGVLRAHHRLAEEADGVGADGLDRLGAAIDFFYVYAGGQITRSHGTPPVGCPAVAGSRGTWLNPRPADGLSAGSRGSCFLLARLPVGTECLECRPAAYRLARCSLLRSKKRTSFSTTRTMSYSFDG